MQAQQNNIRTSLRHIVAKNFTCSFVSESFSTWDEYWYRYLKIRTIFGKIQFQAECAGKSVAEESSRAEQLAGSQSWQRSLVDSGVSIISKNWVFYKGGYESLKFSIRRWSVVFYKRGIVFYKKGRFFVKSAGFYKSLRLFLLQESFQQLL